MVPLKKAEVFNLIIFSAMFLYFVILKLLGYITISWTAMLVPLYAFAFVYILIKIIKQWCKKKADK